MSSSVIENFSLFGGPLHRLGRRVGLIGDGTGTIRFGLALGVLLWAVLAVLALIEGVDAQVFSLQSIGAHVRLLLAIPLFFVCETWVNPRTAEFVRTIVRARVVPEAALPTLEADIQRTVRLKDTWLPEAFCLLFAVLLLFIAPRLQLYGVTTVYDPGRRGDEVLLTGQWYWIVCMTLFRYLMFRWLWRLYLWIRIIWQISRLPLRLVPTHPDGAAGLGSLESVQYEFIPLALAISAVQSASFAEEIVTGQLTLDSIYVALALILLVDAVLFLGPLFLFGSKLWACKIKGLADYGVFAARYVAEFERKWLGADATAKESPLGSADLQSLADLASSVDVVRGMRVVPISVHLLAGFTAAAMLPMAPLLLLKFPLMDLAEKLLSILLGL